MLLVMSPFLPITIQARSTSEASAAVTASPYGRVSVSGSDFLIGGKATPPRFFGVVDTTALQFAILAFVEGRSSHAGKSSVFPGPDTGNHGVVSPHDTASNFFGKYFSLLVKYGCNTVRIGAADDWGSGIQYEVWKNQPEQYLSLLRIMCDQAAKKKVWIVLSLAGSQEYPAYSYSGSGTVFNTSSIAYENYVEYCRSVMSAVDGKTALAWYDIFNEPDHNDCHAMYWIDNGGKTAFFKWASAVATDTSGVSSHPRTMGVAGLGNMFGWGQEDFDLCTGMVPFEIASRHYYASNEDMNNFATPQTWAKNDGKPLFWGELADNSVYPLRRYIYAENAIYVSGGSAITSMVLTGTMGYPEQPSSMAEALGRSP